MEFKAFNKIPSLKKIEMTVTQKIHGSNAQVVIEEVPEFQDGSVQVDDKFYLIRAGSRSRWIFPGDDNYGFAAFVDTNKEEFIRCLGVGQHFGEWAGAGVNSGEGLKTKVFVLFEHWKYPPECKLPPGCIPVPVLYHGPFELAKIDEVMTDLKTNGSKLCPGFMNPEGIVIDVLGQKIKKVFEAEETQWKGVPKADKGNQNKKPEFDWEAYGYLFQPIRLEKLLSRDEKYLTGYPATLPQICADYMADLLAENQIKGDADEIKATKKIIGGHLFGFIKDGVNQALRK